MATLINNDSDMSDKSGRVLYFINKRRKPVKYYKHKFANPEKARAFYRWLDSLETKVTNLIFRVMQSGASAHIDYFKNTLVHWQNSSESQSKYSLIGLAQDNETVDAIASEDHEE